AASAAAAPKKPAAHPAAAARPASKPFVGPPAPAKKPVARRPAARRPKKPAVAHTPLPVLPALGPLTPARPPFQLDAMRKRIADREHQRPESRAREEQTAARLSEAELLLGQSNASPNDPNGKLANLVELFRRLEKLDQERAQLRAASAKPDE